MFFRKSKRLLILLLMLPLLLSACQKQETSAYFEPLFDFVTQHGYAYTFAPLSQQGKNVEVPIYNETVWYSLKLGEEELLVYFDDSNRAKQLSAQFCESTENQKVIYVGMRFIICYRGTDEGIKAMMDAWQDQYPV